jgi:hypothetical protein
LGLSDGKYDGYYGNPSHGIAPKVQNLFKGDNLFEDFWHCVDAVDTRSTQKIFEILLCPMGRCHLIFRLCLYFK